MKKSSIGLLSTVFCLAILSLQCFASAAHAQTDLNGEWRSDSGGFYEIRQRGTRVIWEAHSPDGVTWTHRFVGRLQGNILEGFFRDHPPGRYRNYGQLVFEVSGSRIYRLNRTSAFADTQLTYAGPYRAPYYASESTEPAPSSADEQPPPQNPAPSPAMSKLAQNLDNLIALDARTWISDRYDAGSVYDVQIESLSADNTRAIVFARYTYNGGEQGWVRVHTANGGLDCMEFHNFEGTCRPLGESPSIAMAHVGETVALLAVAAGVAAAASGGSSQSSSSGGSSSQQPDPNVGWKFSHDNAEHQANCPGNGGNPC